MRPHHLAIGLGIAFAVGTAVSGILPLILDWHSDSAIQREVFENVPGPLQLAFYTIIPVLLVWGAFAFAARMRNWERGSPAPGARRGRTRLDACATSAPASTCARCCATPPPG
ncbi:MAG: hypothetical protein WKF58_03350 [Ilumatobacteraceae bacterium]